MKPLKSALPIATWFLRIFFAAYIFTSNIKGVNPINLESLNFYLSLATLILSVLLIIGGFTSSQTLTVVSSILIGIILTYRFLIPTPDLLSESTFKQLLMISISFFFTCRSN